MTDPDLKKFCREMLIAIEGKVSPYWFNIGYGLCTNAGRYDRENDTFVYDTLHDIFKGEVYPFNNGDSENYRNERWHGGGLYENEIRINFLKKYAEID